MVVPPIVSDSVFTNLRFSSARLTRSLSSLIRTSKGAWQNNDSSIQGRARSHAIWFVRSFLRVRFGVASFTGTGTLAKHRSSFCDSLFLCCDRWNDNNVDCNVSTESSVSKMREWKREVHIHKERYRISHLRLLWLLAGNRVQSRIE